MMATPGYFLCRIETRKDERLGPLRRHVRGERLDPTNADMPDLCKLAHGKEHAFTKLVESATPADIKRWRADAKAARTRGPRPDPWVECVMVGPKVIDWTPERADEWANDCLATWNRLMPHAQTIECVLHGRETQWHVHLLAQPRGHNAKGQLRCSRNAMNLSAVEIITGEPPPAGGVRSMQEHRDDYSRVLDEFHAVCGEPYGLLRGEKGNKEQHTEIDPAERVKSTVASLRELEERRREELAEVVDFKAAKQALDQERKALETDRAEHRAAVKAQDERGADFEAKRKQAVANHNKAVAATNLRARAVRDGRKQLEEREAALEKRAAEQEAVVAANNRRARELEDASVRNATANQINRQHRRKLSAAAKRLCEQRTALRQQQKMVTRARDVLDACIHADLDADTISNALFAVLREGIPLPDAATEALRSADERKRRLAEQETSMQGGVRAGREGVGKRTGRGGR